MNKMSSKEICSRNKKENIFFSILFRPISSQKLSLRQVEEKPQRHNSFKPQNLVIREAKAEVMDFFSLPRYRAVSENDDFSSSSRSSSGSSCCSYSGSIIESDLPSPTLQDSSVIGHVFQDIETLSSREEPKSFDSSCIRQESLGKPLQGQETPEGHTDYESPNDKVVLSRDGQRDSVDYKLCSVDGCRDHMNPVIYLNALKKTADEMCCRALDIEEALAEVNTDMQVDYLTDQRILPLRIEDHYLKMEMFGTLLKLVRSEVENLKNQLFRPV